MPSHLLFPRDLFADAAQGLRKQIGSRIMVKGKRMKKLATDLVGGSCLLDYGLIGERRR